MRGSMSAYASNNKPFRAHNWLRQEQKRTK